MSSTVRASAKTKDWQTIWHAHNTHQSVSEHQAGCFSTEQNWSFTAHVDQWLLGEDWMNILQFMFPVFEVICCMTTVFTCHCSANSFHFPNREDLSCKLSFKRRFAFKLCAFRINLSLKCSLIHWLLSSPSICVFKVFVDFDMFHVGTFKLRQHSKHNCWTFQNKCFLIHPLFPPSSKFFKKACILELNNIVIPFVCFFSKRVGCLTNLFFMQCNVFTNPWNKWSHDEIFILSLSCSWCQKNCFPNKQKTFPFFIENTSGTKRQIVDLTTHCVGKNDKDHFHQLTNLILAKLTTNPGQNPQRTKSSTHAIWFVSIASVLCHFIVETGCNWQPPFSLEWLICICWAACKLFHGEDCQGLNHLHIFGEVAAAKGSNKIQRNWQIKDCLHFVVVLQGTVQLSSLPFWNLRQRNMWNQGMLTCGQTKPVMNVKGCLLLPSCLQWCTCL